MTTTQDSQDRVTRFFDGYAEDFHSIYNVGDRSLVERTLDSFTRRSMFLRFERAAQIFEEAGATRLLDVGCGPGQHAVKLAVDQGMEAVGVDVAPAMLQIADELAAEHGVTERCTFIEGDFMEVELEGKFDAALSVGVVEYIMDPAPFVRRMMEVVEGTIVFSLPVKWHLLTPQRAVRYRLRNCPLRFYSRGDITELMRECGATRYRVEAINRDYLVVIQT